MIYTYHNVRKNKISLIQKAKNFLSFDIKEDKYALVDDPIFGKVAKDKAPDKWVRSTSWECTYPNHEIEIPAST